MCREEGGGGEGRRLIRTPAKPVALTSYFKEKYAQYDILGVGPRPSLATSLSGVPDCSMTDKRFLKYNWVAMSSAMMLATESLWPHALSRKLYFKGKRK